MNIFEYLTANCKNKPYFDEAGNVYIDSQPSVGHYVGYFLHEGYASDGRLDYYFATKEEYDKYAKIGISIAGDIDEGFYDVRKPYFRLRGKPVTEEQAFEIIRRTDSLFFGLKSIDNRNSGYIRDINVSNGILGCNPYSERYGWVHPDGLIGINEITGKYPEEDEFVAEWVKYLAEFPYLDLIVAVTRWDELPDDVWSKDSSAWCSWEKENYGEYDAKFLDAIALGIYVHDSKVEILNSTDACAKYEEYDALYGGQRERFLFDYCTDNGIFEADLGYVKRCIESYGLDPDKELDRLNTHAKRELGID